MGGYGKVGGGMGGWEKEWEGKRDQVMSSCEGNEGKYISTLQALAIVIIQMFIMRVHELETYTLLLSLC